MLGFCSLKINVRLDIVVGLFVFRKFTPFYDAF